MSSTSNIDIHTQHFAAGSGVGAPTILFHWLVAIAILSLAGIGLYMKYTETWPLYSWHKSLGVLALFIIVARIFWRVKQGWLKPAGEATAFEFRLARLVQWLLMTATVMMPLSGMLLSGASGHGFGIFDLVIVPSNYSAENPEEVIPYSRTLADLGYWLHSWAGYMMLAAIALHIMGAIKHHFVNRDLTLLRMLGRGQG